MMGEPSGDPNEIIDNWNPILLNGYPFIREGMTAREYLEERDYWGLHMKEYHNGTYKPLWQQREK